MNGLYFQWRTLESTKDRKKVSVLCIGDRDQGTLIQGEEIIVLFETEKKESQKLKSCLKWLY